MVLSSHSTPPSRLGEHREVNITIRKNDDPFGVIEFIQSGLKATIKESKEDDTYSGGPSHDNDTFLSSRGTAADIANRPFCSKNSVSPRVKSSVILCRRL